MIIKDEIQNFYLDLYTGEPETFSLDFVMENFKGKAKIVVKECQISDKTCEVVEGDL